MKFTEKQYQKIVQIASQYIENSAWGFVGGRYGRQFSEMIYDDELLYNNLDFRKDAEEIMAIANPLTREWAHDNFVEKEPEFHFILKNTKDSEDWTYHLVRNGKGAIILFPYSEERDDNHKFKESEIKKWGYNPEMFDREEVQ